MKHTPYVEFESGDYKGHHIKRVGCMKCNDTIATKNPDGSLYYWTHKRDIKVGLSDGSVAYVPVCSHCHSQPSTQEDLARYENTIKHGWLLEQAWAFKRCPSRGVESITRAGNMAKNIFVVMRGN